LSACFMNLYEDMRGTNQIDVSDWAIDMVHMNRKAIQKAYFIKRKLRF
jgi:hypothetical protein